MQRQATAEQDGCSTEALKVICCAVQVHALEHLSKINVLSQPVLWLEELVTISVHTQLAPLANGFTLFLTAKGLISNSPDPVRPDGNISKRSDSAQGFTSLAMLYVMMRSADSA